MLNLLLLKADIATIKKFLNENQKMGVCTSYHINMTFTYLLMYSLYTTHTVIHKPISLQLATITKQALAVYNTDLV